jgi:predicted DCC family thiol-disulfide oxidoreductase YuxK
VGPEHDIVFYDGACGLCHRLVRFIVKRDRDGHFRFAPLDSEVFRARVPATARRGLPDSIVVLTADGRVLTHSAGVRQVLAHLPRGWPLVGAILAVIPRPMANRGYDLVARARHRLFKKPDGACPMVPPELRSRFL